MAGDPLVLPHDPAAETALIGAVLVDPAELRGVRAILGAEDFFADGNGAVWRAVCAVADAGGAVDPVTVGSELIRLGVRDVGLPALIATAQACVVPSNAASYARTVADCAARRRLIHAAQRVIQEAAGGGAGMDAVLGTMDDAQRGLARARGAHSLLALGDDVLARLDAAAAGTRGIPLPWPTLDNMLMGLWAGTITLFVGRPGTGKCVRGDTLVMDPRDGIYRRIDSLYGVPGMTVLTRDKGGLVPAAPAAYFAHGGKACLRVTTRAGRALVATPEHRVLTPDGWVPMGGLAAGSFLAGAASTPEPTSAWAPPDEEVVLLAALLADGGYTTNSIGFSKSDEGIVDLVRTCAGQYGQALATNGPGQYYFKWADPARWRMQIPSPIRAILDRYGCGRTLSKNKVIPDAVFRYDNASLARFLGVLIGCDGYVDRGGIGITLASQELIEQLQRLLLRFGVQSSVHGKDARCGGKTFPAWRLRVDSDSVVAFHAAIRLVSHAKQQRVKALVAGRKNPNVGGIPMTTTVVDAIRGVVSAMAAADRRAALARMSALLGHESSFSISHLVRRETVSRATFAAFLEAFAVTEGPLPTLMTVAWDRVVSIEDVGTHPVYDLAVPGPDCFVANDLVVHNSQIATIIARHAWHVGHPVLVVSPEMEKEEIAERFFALEAGVSYSDMVRGTVPSAVRPELEKAVDRLRRERGLWIVDGHDDLTPRGLTAAIQACKPALVAVDSLYDLHIQGDGHDRVLGALRWMKRVRRDHRVAFVGFSQQNRDAELSARKGGGSRLGTIGKADELAQDAHNVFALEQDKDMRADHLMRIKPLKSRRRAGAYVPHVDIRWDFQRMDFGEVPAVDDGGAEGY